MSDAVIKTTDPTAPEKFLPLVQAPFLQRFWDRYKSVILTTLGIVLFFLFWEWEATSLKIIEPYFIPPPSKIFRTIWRDTINLDIPTNLLWSLRNYAIGYLIGLAIAIPFGLAMGSIPLINRLISPLFWIIFVIPRIAFLPLVIILLGFGPEGKILFIIESTFFPIAINTIAGVKTVSPSLVKVGRLFGGSRLQIYRKVVLPYAMNFILTGMRVAARTGMVVMYATEIFGSAHGLGTYVVRQSELLNMSGAFAGILVLVVSAMTVLTVFDYTDNKLRPWKSEVAI